MIPLPSAPPRTWDLYPPQTWNLYPTCALPLTESPTVGKRAVHILLDCYRPQRSWGKVIFSEACVNNSVHRGGMHGWSEGGCAWLHGGCVVLLGGHAWFYWEGHAWFYSGGHAWFYLGGMHGFIQGGHAWFYSGGGMHGFFSFFQIQWDKVNERVVRILLECILVDYVFEVKTTFIHLTKKLLNFSKIF